MRGRSAIHNPPNRFESRHYEPLDIDPEYEDDPPRTPTSFLNDTSKTILARNESPDVPFTFSVNPYRGCEHGCIYCYARPTHEYLGFSAGLDFETKIMVKMDAPELIAKALRAKNWKPQLIAVSGNTDCYQPVERKLQLTRRCVSVLLDFRNPVGLITKNALVVRDVDLLQEMASMNLVHVMLSVTTLDREFARIMEPRTSTPEAKLRAIETLAKAGIPVGVMIAPVIPGLTDSEIPRILKAGRDHGATSAGMILLRLPGAVEGLFLEWLKRTIPLKSGKVISLIKQTRHGSMTDSTFGRRMTGEGEVAGMISDLFGLHAKKYGFTDRWKDLSVSRFRKPAKDQQELDFSGSQHKPSSPWSKS